MEKHRPSKLGYASEHIALAKNRLAEFLRRPGCDAILERE